MFPSQVLVIREVRDAMSDAFTFALTNQQKLRVRPLEVLHFLARISTSLLPIGSFLFLIILTLFVQCYIQSENPKECQPLADDYLECLHKPKEASLNSFRRLSRSLSLCPPLPGIHRPHAPKLWKPSSSARQRRPPRRAVKLQISLQKEPLWVWV